MRKILYTLIPSAGISSCHHKMPQEKAEILYFGGPIITMEDSSPQVEAVAVKDGMILFCRNKIRCRTFFRASH